MWFAWAPSGEMLAEVLHVCPLGLVISRGLLSQSFSGYGDGPGSSFGGREGSRLKSQSHQGDEKGRQPQNRLCRKPLCSQGAHASLVLGGAPLPERTVADGGGRPPSPGQEPSVSAALCARPWTTCPSSLAPAEPWSRNVHGQGQTPHPSPHALLLGMALTPPP